LSHAEFFYRLSADWWQAAPGSRWRRSDLIAMHDEGWGPWVGAGYNGAGRRYAGIELRIACETFVESGHANQYQTNFLSLEDRAHLRLPRTPDGGWFSMPSGVFKPSSAVYSRSPSQFAPDGFHLGWPCPPVLAPASGPAGGKQLGNQFGVEIGDHFAHASVLQ